MATLQSVPAAVLPGLRSVKEIVPDWTASLKVAVSGALTATPVAPDAGVS
jgi:hypothetical protein